MRRVSLRLETARAGLASTNGFSGPGVNGLKLTWDVTDTIEMMKEVLCLIKDRAGYPESLRQLLLEQPDMASPLPPESQNIHADSVISWDEMGKTPVHEYPRRPVGFLSGYRFRNNTYEYFTLHHPSFEMIVTHSHEPTAPCDISEVHGFSASKSDLTAFSTTDDMVESRAPDMIDPISHHKLEENLAHREIRIIHSPGVDRFVHYKWTGKTYLCNSGGSHHFAAAKYIAVRLKHRVPLFGPFDTYSLNRTAIAAVRRDYDWFLLAHSHENMAAFKAAMKSLRATWLWHYLPWQLQEWRAVLLPKTEGRSKRAAAVLRDAGATDLGQHLSALAEAQHGAVSDRAVL